MDKNLENKNNNNSNKTSTDALTERLNRIKNDIAIKEGNNSKNEIIVNNNNLNTPDIKKLKDKLKLDMNFVDAYYNLDKSQLVFLFLSEIFYEQ